MNQYKEVYGNYVSVCFKLSFFNSCKREKIIPMGLVIEKNIATHVNDEEFIRQYRDTLSEASSRSFDKVIEKFELSKISLDEELEDLELNMGISRDLRNQIEAEAKEQNVPLKLKLANKHLSQVRRVREEEQSPFELSHGSRKVKGSKYIPPKHCACNPRKERPHRRKRRVKKQMIKEGPKNETLKDIIESEQAKRDPINLTDFVVTDDMKSVLRLGATFAPTPTRPIDIYKLYCDFHKWAENLRWHYLFNHKDPDQENDFVKKPWHKPTDRKAPRANEATEAFILKVQEDLFNPENRRKITDNLTEGQRKAMKELMGLVENHGIIVRFEDKGSRFVIDDIANHDGTLFADLNNPNQYDKLATNPIDHVRSRVQAFAEKWKDELDQFHPNVRAWITNIEDAEPGKVKGLVKCHKASLANGKKPYRLLLCGTNTPVQPLSKLVQDSIQHLVPQLQHKARDTKHIHQIIAQLNRQWAQLGGIPDTAKQVCGDVSKLYPSVDNTMGIPATKRMLESHPNPEGLSTDLIIEALTICLEENFCEFCGEYFKGNSGVQMGPCHACDYCDIFVGELDDDLVQKLADENIEHTPWKIFRDDGWLILLDADQDLPQFQELLEGLHPNIKWDVRVSSAENDHALEHLDLTIFIKEGKIETDNFAKDIPIYLSRKSCHPQFVFKGVLKSSGIRLNQNCSLDQFLWDRKIEYSRYFYASYYKPKEVDEIMTQVTGLTKDQNGDFVRGPARQNRENFIFRPRRNRRSGGGKKKHVLVSDWDPRVPDVSKILKKHKNTLYRDPLNKKLYPEGSVIAGFRKRRNLGEIICPTKPRRRTQPRPGPGDGGGGGGGGGAGGGGGGGGGCGPCSRNRCQIHKHLVATDKVISPWDKRARKIQKTITCTDPNLIYFLTCDPCPMGPGLTAHYTGSSVSFPNRWSKHKRDCEQGKGTDCNFCAHWKQYHSADYSDLSSIKIYFLDTCDNPGTFEDDYAGLKKLEEKWMVTMGSLTALDVTQGCNKKDDAKAKARGS